MRLDHIYSVDLSQVRHSIAAWLGGADRRGPEAHVAAAAVALIAICERFKMKPRPVLEAAERIMRDGNPVEVRALRMYLKEEL